jgi:protein-S-isoprenylcysteine O-methyltransferase Ste14
MQWFPTPTFSLVFAFSFFVWVGIEFINHLIGKWSRLGRVEQTQDRGSYWLISIIAYVSFGFAFAGRLFDWGVLGGTIQYVGLAMMLGSVTFREWAIIVLGRHFSVVVAIETDHQLVTRGPYRWLRHPAYTGGFLAMIGFHLAMGGWVSTLLTAITLLPSFIYRIKVEEEVLLSVFGAEYQAYRHRTWRLFPGW